MSKIKTTLNMLFVFVACVISLFPYLIIIVASFNNTVNIRKGDIMTNISFNNLRANFLSLTSDVQFYVSLKNTLIVTLFSVILGVLLSSLAGYAFVVFKNKLMEKMFKISFLSIMIPSSVIIIPLFMILRSLNILDSLFSIIITSLSLPFLVYLFRQNTKLFPMELIKAARIDGVSEIGIFFRVYIPNMIPAFVTASVILFIDAWNGFLYPLVIIQSQKNMTLALYINSIGKSYTTDYGSFMLTLLFSTLPIILLFVFAQKYFRKGMQVL